MSIFEIQVGRLGASMAHMEAEFSQREDFFRVCLCISGLVRFGSTGSKAFKKTRNRKPYALLSMLGIDYLGRMRVDIAPLLVVWSSPKCIP